MKEGRGVYLKTYSAHFIYGYMVKDYKAFNIVAASPL